MTDPEKFIRDVNAIIAPFGICFEEKTARLIWQEDDGGRPHLILNPFPSDSHDYAFWFNYGNILLDHYGGNIYDIGLQYINFSRISDEVAIQIIQRLKEALAYTNHIRANRNAAKEFLAKENISGKITSQCREITHLDRLGTTPSTVLSMESAEAFTLGKLHYFCGSFDFGIDYLKKPPFDSSISHDSLSISPNVCFFAPQERKSDDLTPIKYSRFVVEDPSIYFRLEQLRQTARHCNIIVIPQSEDGDELIKAIASSLKLAKSPVRGVMLLQADFTSSNPVPVSKDNLRHLHKLIEENPSLLSLGYLAHIITSPPDPDLSCDLSKQLEWHNLLEDIKYQLQINRLNHREQLATHLEATKVAAFEIASGRATDKTETHKKHPLYGAHAPLGRIINEMAAENPLPTQIIPQQNEQKSPADHAQNPGQTTLAFYNPSRPNQPTRVTQLLVSKFYKASINEPSPSTQDPASLEEKEKDIRPSKK